MKKLISILMSMILATSVLTGCGKKTTEKPVETKQPEATQAVQEEKKEEVVTDLYADPIAFTIEMEDGGVMKGELYPHLAPITVENFVKLAKEGFYTGLIFHRVIPGFMIQGGGFDKEMNQKPADSIKGEFASNGVENELKHTRGVLSMARTQVPDSASSQFFIMHEDSPHLDGEYAAFGKVTEGLDIIDEIATTETTSAGMMQDIPVEPQIIKSITIAE